MSAQTSVLDGPQDGTFKRLPDALPPSHSLTVRAADGTPLHTEVFGPPDGYPIVLTHGIVCAIRAWAYQIADLATDFRVIAFDHRGHGRSGVPRRGGYSLEHLASDLDAVLEATVAPHERAVLAGHSMGGIAIAAWSAHYRDKVRQRAHAVALINTTTGDLLREVKLAFLGPVAAIMICDYFVIRRRVLTVDDLYLRDGAYEYSGGFNWRAIGALVVGAGTALVGLVVPPVRILYDYSWFVGFAVSFGAYYALMRLQGESGIRAMEEVL
jgi:pimeloyl-ACP methyl ester carboxylesterase